MFDKNNSKKFSLKTPSQKPHVAGQEFEICFSCSRFPADKVIPGGTLPGCRAKEKAGQGIVLPVKNQILHVLSQSARQFHRRHSSWESRERFQHGLASISR
jgi:hypothetical protein